MPFTSYGLPSTSSRNVQRNPAQRSGQEPVAFERRLPALNPRDHGFGMPRSMIHSHTTSSEPRPERPALDTIVDILTPRRPPPPPPSATPKFRSKTGRYPFSSVSARTGASLPGVTAGHIAYTAPGTRVFSATAVPPQPPPPSLRGTSALLPPPPPAAARPHPLEPTPRPHLLKPITRPSAAARLAKKAPPLFKDGKRLREPETAEEHEELARKRKKDADKRAKSRNKAASDVENKLTKLQRLRGLLGKLGVHIEAEDFGDIPEG